MLPGSLPARRAECRDPAESAKRAGRVPPPAAFPAVADFPRRRAELAHSVWFRLATVRCSCGTCLERITGTFAAIREIAKVTLAGHGWGAASQERAKDDVVPDVINVGAAVRCGVLCGQ